MKVRLGDEADVVIMERIRRHRVWFDLNGCLDELISSAEAYPLIDQEDKARLDLIKAKIQQIQVVYNE